MYRGLWFSWGEFDSRTPLLTKRFKAKKKAQPLSMTILGTGDAAKLPKIAGRFVAWDGTVFQSYYFPNYK